MRTLSGVGLEVSSPPGLVVLHKHGLSAGIASSWSVAGGEESPGDLDF